VADELHRWGDAERYAILLAGVQKRDGRLFGISTAGVKDEGLLWAMRERALELGAKRSNAYLGLRTGRLAWHEWSLPPEADPRDLEAVADANPAPWVTVELLRERFESPSMTLADFRRFSCNQWVERAEVEAVFDPHRWAELENGIDPPRGPVVFAIDATMDRGAAAIGVAQCMDGDLALVDCVESGAGIAWVLDRALELQRHHDPLGFVIDAGGPANTLIPRLQEFGISVIECSMREVAQASTGFYDAVTAGTVRHRGSPPLNQSVQGAVKRSLAQSWAFDRRKALADPAPLIAAALALWGLRTHGPISTAAFRERFGD